MKNVKSLVISTALAGGLAAATFGFAVPALAGPTGANATTWCPSNNTCAYVDANYNTFMGNRVAGTGLQNISEGNRNRLSSWINNSGTGARFYYGLNGTGTCVPMYANNRATVVPGHYNPDNDQAESWAFTRTC